MDRPLRVLVVEDDAAVAETVCDVLEEHGFTVTCAPHGRAAFEVLLRASFDAVLTDVSMPRMDGRKLVLAIRRRGMAVPVILLSARPDTPWLFDRLGADGFLMKPFDMGDLVSTVRAVAAPGSATALAA